MATLRIGDFVFNEEAGTLAKDNENTVRLSPRSADVLATLIAAGNEVVSRDHLHETVWQGRIVTDVQISKAVGELRAAFQDRYDNPCYIETLPRRGYRLVQSAVEPSVNLSQAYKRKVAINQIETAAEDLTRFAETVRQDLIHELSKTSLQIVSSHGGSPYFEIVGSIRRGEQDLQVTLQIIDSSTGRIHWSKVLIEPSTAENLGQARYFANMARKVVSIALKLEKHRPNQVASHEYMMAIMEFEELTQGNGGNFGALKMHLEAALEADPDFLQPLFYLAMFYKNRYGGLMYEEAIGPAHEYARKLLEHYPNSTGLLSTINRQLDLDYEAAKANLDHDRKHRASGLTLGEYEAEIAWTLMAQGEIEPAIEHLKSALSVDTGTNRRAATLTLASANFILGNYAEMDRWLEELHVDPNARGDAVLFSSDFQVLEYKTYACYYLNRIEEAEATFDWILRRYGPGIHIRLCALFALLGRTDEATAILSEADQRFVNKQFVDCTPCFWCCFYLDRIDDAMIWLYRAIDNREFLLFAYLHKSTLLDGLRDDQRFIEAMRYRQVLESTGTPTKSVAYP